jgi:hypothetical protein
MNYQDFRNLQEAYMEVVEGFRDLPVEKMKEKESSLRSKNTDSGERRRSNIENVRTNIGKSQKTQSFGGRSGSETAKKTSAKHHASSFLRHKPYSPQDTPEKPDHKNHPNMYIKRGAEAKERHLKQREGRKRIQQESYDLYDIILSHLLDEGFADTQEAAEAIMVNMSEDWRQDIMEKEDSEYEKASDAALDKRYGYGRASGDKRSFGRAANRSSAAAALRAIRRGERSGSGTSREAGSDAVHQGWAKTAKTSADQTPEKKARRAKLANTSYSNLPDDEKEKDRVSFDAVRATYNKNKK